MSNEYTDAMDRVMKVINDAENGVETNTTSKETVQSMEDILRRFNSALTEASTSSDKPLELTNETEYLGDKKLRVGDYVIEKVSTGYSLHDANNIELLNDISLYETVYTVASYLHRGHNFSSTKIINLLHDNSRYEKHLGEAKQNHEMFDKYKQDQEFGRMDLLETKFEENKFRANQFKSKILTKYNALGK